MPNDTLKPAFVQPCAGMRQIATFDDVLFDPQTLANA